MRGLPVDHLKKVAFALSRVGELVDLLVVGGKEDLVLPVLLAKSSCSASNYIHLLGLISLGTLLVSSGPSVCIKLHTCGSCSFPHGFATHDGEPTSCAPSKQLVHIIYNILDTACNRRTSVI